jgi:hypothetical protein
MSERNQPAGTEGQEHDVDAVGATGQCTRCGAALIPGTTATGVDECSDCLYGPTSQPWDDDAGDGEDGDNGAGRKRS